MQARRAYELVHGLLERINRAAARAGAGPPF